MRTLLLSGEQLSIYELKVKNAQFPHKKFSHELADFLENFAFKDDNNRNRDVGKVAVKALIGFDEVPQFARDAGSDRHESLILSIWTYSIPEND